MRCRRVQSARPKAQRVFAPGWVWGRKVLQGGQSARRKAQRVFAPGRPGHGTVKRVTKSVTVLAASIGCRSDGCQAAEGH